MRGTIFCNTSLVAMLISSMSTQSPFFMAFTRLPSRKLKIRLLSIRSRFARMLSKRVLSYSHSLSYFFSSTFPRIFSMDIERLFNSLYSCSDWYKPIRPCRYCSFFSEPGIVLNFSMKLKKSSLSKLRQSIGLNPPTRSITSVPEDILYTYS